jgi:hypothetical protein
MLSCRFALRNYTLGRVAFKDLVAELDPDLTPEESALVALCYVGFLGGHAWRVITFRKQPA